MDILKVLAELLSPTTFRAKARPSDETRHLRRKFQDRSKYSPARCRELRAERGVGGNPNHAELAYSRHTKLKGGDKYIRGNANA